MYTFFGSRRQGLVWASLLCWCSAVVSAQTSAAPTATPASPMPTAAGWQGCEDPVNGKKLVTIGEKTTICLSIADGLDWTTQRTYMRLNFQPIADQYSRFLVPNSFQQLVVDTGTPVSNMFIGKNISVHVSSQKGLSFQKRYFDGFKKIYPFLTAIIDVKNGVVTGIAWDDAGIFCGPTSRFPNTFDYAGLSGSAKRFGQPVEGCAETLDSCKADSGKTTICDLLLYVVWTGTDSNGKPFMSSSYRYSAFPPQNWAARLTKNIPSIASIPKIPNVNPFSNKTK